MKIIKNLFIYNTLKETKVSSTDMQKLLYHDSTSLASDFTCTAVCFDIVKQKAIVLLQVYLRN